MHTCGSVINKSFTKITLQTPEQLAQDEKFLKKNNNYRISIPYSS